MTTIGLAMGSFVGTVALRLPQHADIVKGRSACPICGTRLLARDLVPLASWLVLRGRCRHCHEPIGLFYPAVELAALAIALSSAAAVSGWLVWAGCLFGWALLALALIDLREYLLHDVITLPLLAMGLAVAWCDAPQDFPGHLVGAGLGFAAFALIAARYRHWRGREGLGRGDAKLAGALGAWIGWSGLPSVVLLASLSALAVAALRQAWGARLSAADRIAFGPYLAAAGWIVWLHGPLFFG